MAAGQVDFIVDQGEDWTCQLVWTDFYDEPLPVSSPMRMDIKSPYGVVVRTLVSSNTAPPDGVVPDISWNTDVGMIQLHLDSGSTGALAAGVYDYDLFGTLSEPNELVSSQVARIIFGTFIVRQRTTATL